MLFSTGEVYIIVEHELDFHMFYAISMYYLQEQVLTAMFWNVINGEGGWNNVILFKRFIN